MYLLVEKGIIKRAKPKGSILEIADNTRERKESTEATKDSTEATKDSTEAIKDNIEGTKDSTETTTLLKTLVEQQKEVIRMLSTVITQTSKAVPTSIAVCINIRHCTTSYRKFAILFWLATVAHTIK